MPPSRRTPASLKLILPPLRLLSQIHLGDRPSDITRRRLVAGISDGMAGKTIAAVSLLSGAVAAAALGALPNGAVAPAVAVASASAGASPVNS
jgi:hypothetical protein